MKQLLNTMYITSPDAYLALDGENAVVRIGEETAGRVPLHNVGAIVCFGYKGVSPAMMGACAERQIALSFLSPHGRFLARVTGPVQGNVLLRRTQMQRAEDEAQALVFARRFIQAKIYNGRWCLGRVLRDHPQRVDDTAVNQAVSQMRAVLDMVPQADSCETLMGLEGLAAKAYFGAFQQLILRNETAFRFDGRSRRPPLDRVNALLSLGYTLLGNEIAAALEAVGLDPCVGFLHQLRPGRKSLALDLLEELRAPVVDRFAVSQINLGAIAPNDFEQKENGAFYLKDDARTKFLAAWQKQKQEPLTHPFLREKMNWGLLPHVQAMLLARALRGDLDSYPPFFWK